MGGWGKKQWIVVSGLPKKWAARGMPAAQAGSPTPRRPIVVTFTTEYKYGEIGEIIGKLGKKFLGSVFSGLRGFARVWRVDKRAAITERDQKMAGGCLSGDFGERWVVGHTDPARRV
jgi:hypothetical protein